MVAEKRLSAIDLERRITALCWLKESIKALLTMYSTFVRTKSKIHANDFLALQSCLQILENADEQLTALKNDKAKPAKIAAFFKNTRADEIALDLLEQFWNKGVLKNKDTFLFSAMDDAKDNFVNILNDRDKNHFLRMVGIILQEVQANQLDPKHRVFISRLDANFIFNPYSFLNNFVASQEDIATLPKKEFSNDELHTIINRLIFIVENMGHNICKKKELDLLKSAQNNLEKNNALCLQALIEIFNKKAENMGGMDQLIKALNRNFDCNILYREIGLVLQNQFHLIATGKWERKIVDIRHFHITPTVFGVFRTFKQMYI